MGWDQRDRIGRFIHICNQYIALSMAYIYIPCHDARVLVATGASVVSYFDFCFDVLGFGFGYSDVKPELAILTK